MLGFIYLIVMIFAIVIVVPKARKAMENSEKNGISIDEARARARAAAIESVTKVVKNVEQRVHSGSSTAKTIPSIELENSSSTTAYLHKKAVADQIEHRREKRAEEERLRRETGGRMPAIRYITGDSTLRGHKIVKCGYCAAENQIPDYVDEKKYTCYFCREIL